MERGQVEDVGLNLMAGLSLPSRIHPSHSHMGLASLPLALCPQGVRLPSSALDTGTEKGVPWFVVKAPGEW